MAISFEKRADPPGLEIYDSIEQRHLSIESPVPLAVVPTENDAFVFPVDTTCSVETTSLTFNNRGFVSVHDEEGRCIETLNTGDSLSLEDETQFIGLNGPVQIYCRVTSTGYLETGFNTTKLSFDQKSAVVIGARSHHEQPVGTIQTPEDPMSMMRAVSLLSSALKTTSPERAWPSLRGHPPLIECSDEFDAPADLSPASTDVTITVRPTYRDLFTVAPLAFYVGARVESGSEPALKTPSAEYPLEGGTTLADSVATLLKQFFLLDCVVRTEGLFRTDLYEREQIEEDIPFNLADTYELPLSERLPRYLTVSYEDIEQFVPHWPVTAHVPGDPDTIEVIPYIVNELGIIRDTDGEFIDIQDRNQQAEAALLRSTTPPHRSSDIPEEPPQKCILPDVTDESLEHAWFGDYIPQKASKATLEAFQSQLSQSSKSDSIEILLVCNDSQMLEEHDLLDDAYGDRDLLPYNIHSEFGVTTSRFESLLTEGDYDFLHFIGHASSAGLHCSDGILDVRTVESVTVNVFFLNACQSYEQGLALARNGAFGGVSTLHDVVNTHAIEAGETMARLLNRGFPLRASLEIARQNSMLGDEYLIVGDGSADIAQPEDGAPLIADIERVSESEFEFTAHSYPTKEFKLGTTTQSTLQTTQDKHLTPSSTSPTRVATDALEEYLAWTSAPVLFDEELHWNDSIGLFPFD